MQGSGCRIGFRVQGAGFRVVWGLGCRVHPVLVVMFFFLLVNKDLGRSQDVCKGARFPSRVNGA